ncbi:division/cell wall cluster transcriptional repressor MraZ [Donghicola tyrosinivorans]|uniref:Transcriptional regulator MraZ n=1 Tax=Donghicola tyrosinivorans TaxID=1652492 RepID=A0A2T0WWZ3_9RHOB|nr:division/cell wall cluster transcriptional repressor MraZ [Donghicola tyrosinivorans]PRY91195.1 MraZ protein [Donghicola tyrosinivorans]
MSRKLRFIGSDLNKVDTKGRVSIPADFRRVLCEGDPDYREGENQPKLVIVYGDYRRNYLECFTIQAIEEIYDRIETFPRGDKRRKVLEQMYSTNAMTLSVDETGRLVLPAKLRNKIDLDGSAFFAGKVDQFEIWKPETYNEHHGIGLEADDDFDPDLDPSAYL